MPRYRALAPDVSARVFGQPNWRLPLEISASCGIVGDCFEPIIANARRRFPFPLLDIRALQSFNDFGGI